MLVRPAGSVRLVKPVQPLNAELPILVRPSGSVRLVRPVQPLNAELPILVRLSGSSIAASFPYP